MTLPWRCAARTRPRVPPAEPSPAPQFKSCRYALELVVDAARGDNDFKPMIREISRGAIWRAGGRIVRRRPIRVRSSDNAAAGVGAPRSASRTCAQPQRFQPAIRFGKVARREFSQPRRGFLAAWPPESGVEGSFRDGVLTSRRAACAIRVRSAALGASPKCGRICEATASGRST